MKKIITVKGALNADDCGMILAHEHMFIDLRNQASADASDDPVSLQNREQLLQDPYCIKDNLLIDNLDFAVQEAASLVKNNCNTVVDCTLKDIGRDPLMLKRLSEQSNLNIVMGCGWYTGDTHKEDVSLKDIDTLAEELIFEIENGVENTGIRPGIIGEIGTGKKISDNEWKTLEAAAVAQKHTGLALQVHIYPWSDNGLAVVEKLTSCNVAPDRIVICHSDVQPQWDYIRKLLDYGVYVEMDNFGKEFHSETNGFAGGCFATDEERVRLAVKIINEGFGSQLLLTNDICLKCMLSKYGGEGYLNVLKNIIPMFVEHGISEQYLHETIMRANPIRMLTGK